MFSSGFAPSAFSSSSYLGSPFSRSFSFSGMMPFGQFSGCCYPFYCSPLYPVICCAPKRATTTTFGDIYDDYDDITPYPEYTY